MRIFIWHGYLLGGTGSNIYTRQLAREWGRAGHDVTVFSQEPGPSTSTSAARRRSTGRRRSAARLRDRPLRGVRGEAGAGLLARGARRAGSRRTPPRSGSTGRPTSCSSTTCCSAAPSAPRAATRTWSRPTARSSSTRCAATPELSAWGGEVLAGAPATIVGSGHIRDVVREVCGTVDGVHEIPPGVDVELWRPAPREQALERLSPSRASTRRTRATPRSGCPTRQRGAARGVPRRRPPDRRLLREADREQGRAGPARGAARARRRAVIVGFGDCRAELERQAGASTRSSPARWSTATSSTSSRWPTPPWCRRSSPRRSAWSRPRPRPPAARRSSPTTPAWPRSPAGWRRHTHPSAAAWRASPPATPPRCAERLAARPGASRTRERDALRAAARRAVVERWSWSSVAERIVAVAG